MRAYNIIKQKSQFVKEDISREFLRVRNHELHSIKQASQFEYYVRAYYHYNYVKKLGGECFFYTLTLNQKNLHHADCYFDTVPEFAGLGIGKNFRCFDYDHEIRWLLNSSGFRHALKKLGYKLDYFITAELGSLYGRPHYHGLFYVYDHDGILPPINPDLFDHLLRKYWHGFTSDTAPFIELRHKDAIRGIVKAGKLGAVVQDPRALQYVAKYVGKDINVDTLVKKAESLCFRTLYSQHFLNDWSTWCEQHDPLNDGVPTKQDVEYKTFVKNKIKPRVKEIMQKFKCRCTNRVRISQGFGLSIIDNVDINNPYVELPVNGCLQRFDLPLYCFRKLFYEYHDIYGNRLRHLDGKIVEFVEIEDSMTLDKNVYIKKGCVAMVDGKPVNENTYRKLTKYLVRKNKLFFDYSKSQLYARLNRECQNLRSALLLLFDKKSLSQFQSRYRLPYHDLRMLNSVLDNMRNLSLPTLWTNEVYDYAVYNLVYRYRLFDYNCPPTLHLENDYAKSLQELHYNVYYTPVSFEQKLTELPFMCDYIFHDRFDNLSLLVSIFDDVLDFALTNKSVHDASEYNKKREIKEFHNNIKYNLNLAYETGKF